MNSIVVKVMKRTKYLPIGKDTDLYCKRWGEETQTAKLHSLTIKLFRPIVPESYTEGDSVNCIFTKRRLGLSTRSRKGNNDLDLF